MDFIYTNGTSCTGNSNDEFADSKTHYNPKNCPHPYHAGDLPPLIENNGYAYMSVLVNKFNINDIIGKPLNFATKRPLTENIKKLKEISKISNIDLYILSICKKNFQIDEKICV